MPALAVVIPTHNRRPVLAETLHRLERQVGAPAFQVVVVDDGSTDGSREFLEKTADAGALHLTVLHQSNRGPAAARNRGIAAAEAATCLFLGDDSWAAPDLIKRHVDFHGRHPAEEDALLGRTVWEKSIAGAPFMRWLEETGLQFDFSSLADGLRPSGRHFYTSNLSAKKAFLERAHGFDESFPAAAGEDIDLGRKLDGMGLGLTYDPGAVVEHYHPTGLDDAVRRMGPVARAGVVLARRYPDRPVPSQPALRHRLAATALEAALAAAPRRERVRRAAWSFLVQQAYREAWWRANGGPESLATGARLLARALADPAARAPEPT